MHPSSDSSQQTSLLDTYINFRFNQIKAKNGATDLNAIKNSEVIFLDPTRHINARGSVDQFQEIKLKLDELAGDGGYKPTTTQKFFSFTNNLGSHWNLSCRTIDADGSVKEDKIACTGDGACGIHAIVEAVLKSDKLRQTPLIRDNLYLLGNPLPKTSTKPQNAIDFVLAIFEGHKKAGNTARTTERRIATLKNLKKNLFNSSNWALSDDFAIFAEASNILLLNSGLIIGANENNPNQELRNIIIQNILQRDEEKTDFLSFFRSQQSSDLVFDGRAFDNAFGDLFSQAHDEYSIFNASFSNKLADSKIDKEMELIQQIQEHKKDLDIANLIQFLENVDERLFILHGVLDEILENKGPATSDDPTSLATKVSLIIYLQNQIYNDLFDDRGNVKSQESTKALKEHVPPGMDWWVFPGYTESKEPDKFTATTEIYEQLATDKEYCQRYKTFIYQYINSFDKNEEIPHPPRFFKLVESLVKMTDEGKRVLAGFTQKEQDILFIAVNNFYKEKGGIDLVTDTNYTDHFDNLEKIAKASTEINRYDWLDSTRKKLRARLELDEHQIYSSQIAKKINEPIFENNKKLDQDQKKDFDKRLKPYSQNNKIGCGTFEEEIGGEKVSYPFCHFRMTHDPIAEKDNNSSSDKVNLIDEKEYLKHPPITAICIDYPDYGHLQDLPTTTLKQTYKQKTLETLTLYNKLEVDHLVKHGDGMGVFLNNIYKQDNLREQRDPTIVDSAFADYLDGFFDAITEFYNNNPNATLKKITFVTPDKALEKIFNEKLVAFKGNSDGLTISNLVEIKQDKAGPRFNSSKYYEQGTKKLGMTIAPNGNKKFLGGALRTGTVLEEQIALLSDMASIGNPNFNPNVTKKLSIFKDQNSDYCTFFHQDKYDLPIIEFNTEKDSKFDYKKRLGRDEEFKSEKFTKDSEQEEILKLLRQAKDQTLTGLNISEIDDNFFVAVMKVASKHSGIARINTHTFNKDLKEALENLGSSTDSINFKTEPSFHKIAKLFSANFQESSRKQNYLTAREGENDKINETGRRLFRVCTEENIQNFQRALQEAPNLKPTPRTCSALFDGEATKGNSP